MQSKRRHFLQLGASVASSSAWGPVATATLALASTPAAMASDMPKTITLLVGYPPGSGMDYVGRLLSERLQAVLGIPVIVDNRAGASGRIALQALKNAKTDGSVLGLVPSSAMTLFPHIYKNLSYSPDKDFLHVGKVCSFYCGIVSSMAAPYRSLQEFVTWAQSNKATYGHPGQGTSPQFAGFLFAKSAQVALTDIAYRGGPPVTQAAVTGEVAVAFNLSGTFTQMKNAGKLRMLAVTAPHRMPSAPEVPTLKELGYENAVVGEIITVSGPAGLHTRFAQQLADAMKNVYAQSAFTAILKENDYFVEHSNDERLRLELKGESDRWAKVAAETGYFIEG